MRRRRVCDGGRLRGEASAQTWKCAAPARGGRRPASVCGACRWRSSFTSQREDGIEPYRAADRGGASGEGHNDGESEDDREEHGLDGNLRVEDGAADLVSEQGSSGESGDAANKCEKQGLRKEDRGDREIARAERFHQADFDAALKDGSGHRSRNSEG